jgi:integral membrane protein (TIGR01906 family)
MAGDGERAGEAVDKGDPPVDNAGVAVAGRQGATHMGFGRVIATLLFIVALPLALLTTNIRILANAPQTYDYAFDTYNVEQVSGLSRADLDATGAAIRRYFNNDEPVFRHTVTRDGLQVPVFGARETLHMQDVKELFVWNNRVQELTAFYVLAYVVVFFLWAREGSGRQLAAQALAGIGLGVAVLGGLGIFIAMGFEEAFTRFHLIAFSNDFWLLNPATDHLIQMFPQGFWQDVTLFLGLMWAVEATLISAVAAVYLVGSRGERRPLPSGVDVHASGPQMA